MLQLVVDCGTIWLFSVKLITYCKNLQFLAWCKDCVVTVSIVADAYST